MSKVRLDGPTIFTFPWTDPPNGAVPWVYKKAIIYGIPVIFDMAGEYDFCEVVIEVKA